MPPSTSVASSTTASCSSFSNCTACVANNCFNCLALTPGCVGCSPTYVCAGPDYMFAVCSQSCSSPSTTASSVTPTLSVSCDQFADNCALCSSTPGCSYQMLLTPGCVGCAPTYNCVANSTGLASGLAVVPCSTTMSTTSASDCWSLQGNCGQCMVTSGCAYCTLYPPSATPYNSCTPAGTCSSPLTSCTATPTTTPQPTMAPLTTSMSTSMQGAMQTKPSTVSNNAANRHLNLLLLAVIMVFAIQLL